MKGKKERVKNKFDPICFRLISEKEFFITSHNTAYPVSAFYKSLHPNATHFACADTLGEVT